MIKKLVHFSDLHIRLFKDHDLYKSILETAIDQWKELEPDRIVFTGDLVHSKNQMTPELIEMVRWILTECSYIAKTIIIPGNHDFLVNNTERLDALSPIINSLNSENIVYYKDRGVYEDENISWCVYSQRQEFKFKTGKGYMIGSPIQQNIGESIGRHGYGVYDVDTKEYSYFDLPNPKPFLKFSIKSFEDIENGSEKLQNI
jgi:predicted MPP superfamily phosphohydrolase